MGAENFYQKIYQTLNSDFFPNRTIFQNWVGLFVCSSYLFYFIVSFQNLISAATGVNLTTVDDPIQRKFLPSFLRGIAEENKLVTSPNFVVTQALVALLADKGAKLRPNYDKAEFEKKGMIRLLFILIT